MVRAVGVVLADVAARSPKANALAADVQSARDAGRAVVKVVVRALGDDLPLCDLGKIGWDALLTRRRGVLAAGLGLVRRWLRIQGGSLGVARPPTAASSSRLRSPPVATRRDRAQPTVTPTDATIACDRFNSHF